MICIYHNRDLDGYCSGAIVKKRYPDCKLIGFDYGKTLPMEEIPAGEPIIIVDVSLPMEEMASLAKHSGWQLTWIDHHISAIKDFEQATFGSERFCNAVLNPSISACEGAWKYLFPEIQMPLAVQLLGEYDTWRDKNKDRWDNIVMPFQYGMRMECNEVDSFPPTLLEARGHDWCFKIMENGRLILAYQKMQNERACKASFEIEFEGYRAICLNVGGGNSQMFATVYDESKHDIMMPFFLGEKHWTFSIYTTKDEIDCSVLAKRYGGGEHKKAAGFQTTDAKSIFKREL